MGLPIGCHSHPARCRAMIEYLVTFIALLGAVYARKYLLAAIGGALTIAFAIAMLAALGGQEIEGGE